MNHLLYGTRINTKLPLTLSHSFPLTKQCIRSVSSTISLQPCSAVQRHIVCRRYYMTSHHTASSSTSTSHSSSSSNTVTSNTPSSNVTIGTTTGIPSHFHVD